MASTQITGVLLAGWLMSLSLTCTAGSAADAILGEWVMQDGSARLAVEPDERGYRVRIVALLEPRFVPSDAQPPGPRHDLHNPDVALRARPLEGILLARGLAYADGGWNGRIYDPGSGNSYRCRIEQSGDFLRVHGYVGVALLGRTVYWQRADRYRDKVERMLGSGAAASARAP
jgi:uncharacterized protein (DUF2147 family)